MKFRWIHLLMVLMCVSAGLWLAFAKLVVPQLIESAYRGESLPFLNNMIKGQQVNSVGYYLQKWDQATIDYLLNGLAIWLLILLVSSRPFLQRFRRFMGEGPPAPLPSAGARDIFNPFSMLALALICVPLTIGAIWAFPIWDDAWLWLLLKEKGARMIVVSIPDRPVMATLWSLLATSENALWRASFVAQALLWPALGLLSALLWTHLFPDLRRYAVVVACVTVAPIVSKVQMVTANIALGHLLSVVLSYCAFFLLLRFVTVDDRSGRAALGLSIPILGLAVLLTEYALPVIMVMLVFFWSFAQRAPNPETRVRARRAGLFSILTAGAAYAVFALAADFRARGADVSPFYLLTQGGAHVALLPFRLAEGIWRTVVGSLIGSMAEVTLSSESGVMAAAYGALVAGLLAYGSRSLQHNVEAPSRDSTGTRDVLLPAVALVAGLLPLAAMARIPWDPSDGMSSRVELPLLPIAAALIVLIGLSLVRRRFWAVPIFLLGFAAGHATFAEVWSAIRERQQMSAVGMALQAHLSPGHGYSVAAVDLPERSLGPRRPYELTVRLASTWPQELRGRFWAFRFGGVPPTSRPDLEAEWIFGSRGSCKTPRQFKWGVRLVTRDGPLDQLLWVRPQPDGSISIEPYCMNQKNEHQIPSQHRR